MEGVRIESQKTLEDGAILVFESYSRRYEHRNVWNPWTWFGRVYSVALKHKKEIWNSQGPQVLKQILI